MSKTVELPKYENFCCRICGSKDYDVKRKGSLGGLPETVEYSCSECTVVFKVPKNWSTK